MNKTSDSLKKALINLNYIESQGIITDACSEFSPYEIASKIISPVLDEFGKLWEKGELSLSQIYMIGKISEKILDSILPKDHPERKRQPKMAITVLNDYHVLGKKIIYSQIRSSGYELIDYGRTTVDQLVSLVEKDKIELLLISTLMYPSSLCVKELRVKLDKQCASVKIIVGGAPFNMDDRLWRMVGADKMGHSGSAVLDYINNEWGK
jgi:methanogenic corrinoid protein MtbC1